MAVPILGKELLVVLRKRTVFVTVGLFYCLLSLSVTVTWASESGVFAWRERVARSAFYGFICMGFVFFTFHALFMGSRSISKERESGTSELLQVSPIRSLSLVFQKMLTPLSIEWLVLVGALPFLSLVFLLGGISFTEFGFQLVNLGVWLNTCVLVGLWASARFREPAKADRLAAAVVLFLAGLLYLLYITLRTLVTSLPSVISGDSFLHGIVPLLRFPVRTFEFLSILSPLWMVFSWFAPDWPIVSGPVMEALATWSVDCPALPAWLIHLFLQVVLFLLAVRSWRFFPDSSSRRSWLLCRRIPVREPFSNGWRVHYERELREVFRRGHPRLLRSVRGWLILLGTLVLGAFVGFATGPAIGMVLLWICFGPGSMSFRRERERRTALFLLSSPAPMREVFLGKWLFYQKICLILVLAGTLAIPGYLLGPWTEVTGLGAVGMILLSLPALAAWVPLMSLIGVATGLYPGVSGWMLLVLVPFALCCGGQCFVSLLVPLAMIAAAGVLLRAQSSDDRQAETLAMKRLRNLAGRALLVIFGASVALLAFYLVDPTASLGLFDLAWGITVWIGYVFLAPLCIALAGWVSIVRKTDAWWRRHLLPTVHRVRTEN